MNEIGKKFFKTFDIKPIKLEYPDNFECYPEITDRVFLQLLCLLSQYDKDPVIRSYSDTNKLKDGMLYSCINLKRNKKFKQQVRGLFKEAE